MIWLWQLALTSSIDKIIPSAEMIIFFRACVLLYIKCNSNFTLNVNEWLMVTELLFKVFFSQNVHISWNVSALCKHFVSFGWKVNFRSLCKRKIKQNVSCIVCLWADMIDCAAGRCFLNLKKSNGPYYTDCNLIYTLCDILCYVKIGFLIRSSRIFPLDRNGDVSPNFKSLTWMPKQ